MLDGETSNSAFERINEICSVKELSILSSELWKSGYFLCFKSMTFYGRNTSEYVCIYMHDYAKEN